MYVVQYEYIYYIYKVNFHLLPMFSPLVILLIFNPGELPIQAVAWVGTGIRWGVGPSKNPESNCNFSGPGPFLVGTYALTSTGPEAIVWSGGGGGSSPYLYFIVAQIRNKV